MYKTLNVHIETVHDWKKPFKWNNCNKSFAQKVNLNEHIESVHEGKKPFKCNVCDAGLKRRSESSYEITSIKYELKLPSEVSPGHSDPDPSSMKSNIWVSTCSKKQPLNLWIHEGKKLHISM